MTRDTALGLIRGTLGSCSFFIGWKLEHVTGPWRERARQKRIARNQSLRIARSVDQSRAYFASVKNGRTYRQMPLDISNRGMW